MPTKLTPLYAISTNTVLLLDPVSEEAIECFRANHYAVETCFDRLSEAELTRRLADCHLLCVSRREGEEEQYLTEEVLRSAHRLLAIGCFSRETNIIDMETARQMGVGGFSFTFLTFSLTSTSLPL